MGQGHSYRLRTLFDVVPMPWSWPAEVSASQPRSHSTSSFQPPTALLLVIVLLS